jgi:hypothetical protein
MEYSDSISFTNFYRLPFEKTTLIFAFWQPFHDPNGVNYVAKTTSV